MPRVGEIMTRQVETISSTATVRQAAEQMAHANIGFLVVVDGGSACGVVTDRDLVTRCLATAADPARMSVHECMTPHLATLSENADMLEAGKLMEEHKIRRVLVTDVQGRLSGVVSLGDLATRCRDDHLRAGVLEKVSTGCPC